MNAHDTTNAVNAVNSDSKHRLFLGVSVSMAAIRALTDAARALRETTGDAGMAVRWVAPAAYHVTLKFLGWTRATTVGALEDALARIVADISPFEAWVIGAGAFPDPARARVLWAGVDDTSEGLGRLAARAEQAAAELGFPAERRAFHPHVTLGRLRQPADVRDLLGPYSERKFSKFRISSVILYESVMRSDGSEYVRRAEAELRTRSKPSKRHMERLQGTRDKEVEKEES